MKRIIAAVLLLLHIINALAQNITAAEFFVNADPGAGNGTPIALTPGAQASFTATIPAASLPNGFHFVGIRARQAAGAWGLFETRGFYISSATANVSNITAAEFFIDADPGTGNATPVSLTAGPSPTFVITMPAAALTGGFHFVAIRTRDANGTWGLFETRGFYISTATTNVTNITAAEFFVDADPGTGNGTPITITPGPNPVFMATIPAAALAPGFHFVAIRTRDAQGAWGLFENRGFYISTATNNVTNITAAEFFVDADPGLGNGTPITITPGPNPVFVATVPTASLAPGFHFVTIRTRDAQDKWGLFETRGFYISSQLPNMGPITAGEYFFDTDPGTGNGMPFSFSAPGNTVSETLALTVPPGTTQGDHLLVLRTRDANGFWSLMDTARTITVSGIITTPLRFLSFTGQKINGLSALQWVTENELNTSHFEVERSANGVSFTNIGRVNSVNAGGVHQYTFNDQHPLDGINFYRLKQVDRDGRAAYSVIIRLLHKGYGAVLNVWPNPATSYIEASFAGKRSLVMIAIFDEAGKQVWQAGQPNHAPLRMNVEALPRGRYVVQVSDGETNGTGHFVKQ